MKGAVDRVDIGELLTRNEATILSELLASSEVVASRPESREARRPGVGRTREIDDIPSVIRALLVGYDEV